MKSIDVQVESANKLLDPKALLNWKENTQVTQSIQVEQQAKNKEIVNYLPPKCAFSTRS